MMAEAIKIRASSLAELFDCPARFEAKYVKGLRLPASDTARLGTAVHAGAALFDQRIIEGNPLTPDEAAGAVVDAIHHPDEEVDWGESSPREAESIALPLHKMYCEQIAPLQSYIAVEATCDDLPIEDVALVLTGTLDRIYETSGCLGIGDIKTGKSAVGADGKVNTKGHAAQLGVYELMASRATGLPIDAPAKIFGLQVAKTDKGRRAGVGEISGARSLLVGGDEGPGLLTIASNMLHSGLFYGNPKSQICGEKYCPAFHICRWRR